MEKERNILVNFINKLANRKPNYSCAEMLGEVEIFLKEREQTLSIEAGNCNISDVSNNEVAVCVRCDEKAIIDEEGLCRDCWVDVHGM